MVYPSSDAEVCNENTSDVEVFNINSIVLLLRSAIRILLTLIMVTKNFSDAEKNP